MEDRHIVKLFLQRAESAITAAAKKYGARLTALAQNILRDRRDAEEAVSDTYLALWNTIPPQEPDPLSAYSCRICRNISLKKYRANTAQMRDSTYDLSLEELAGCIPDTTMEERLSARELGRAMDSFLTTQSRDSRVIFLRRYWFGDSVKEISQALGMKENAVSVRLSRTRSALNLYLIKEGYL